MSVGSKISVEVIRMGYTNSLVEVELTWVQDESSWRCMASILNISCMKQVAPNKLIVHVNFVEL